MTWRRVLFVSSTTVGGSGRSQHELAAALPDRGWEPRFLVDDGAAVTVGRRLLDELTDATMRFDGAPAGRIADEARRRLGRRTRTSVRDGVVYEATIAPENAVARVIERHRPDVVVASSIRRVTWRAIRAECRRRGLPTVLYLREATAIGHLTAGLTADLLVANSGTLVSEAARHGVRAEPVPSVVRIDPSPVPPSGQVLLVVNPVRSHGLDVIGPLAAARPDIPIVLQESWPLDPPHQAEVDRLVARHPGVTFRAYEPDAARIYRDARLLLAPHRIDNQPRSVLEAQANGIPVVGADHAGLVEAVGDGGVLVDREATAERWIAAVGDLWDDPDRLDRLGRAAARHADRPDVRPELVVDRFVELLVGLVQPEPVR